MAFTYNPATKKFDLPVEVEVSEVKTHDSEVESFWKSDDCERPKKHRGWVATIWNVENTREFYQSVIDDPSNPVTYIAYGLETCPETGRPHHQAFFYTKTQRRTSDLGLKKLGSMWGPKHCYIRIMRGNFTQNKAYCEKAGQYTEVGVKPAMGRRVDLDETKDLILSGETHVTDILKEDPMRYHMYGRTLEKLQAIANADATRTTRTRGWWLYGESGAGKSYAAHTSYDPSTHYRFQNDNGWWDHYNGQEIVIIDDFRPEQIKFSYLLQLMDETPGLFVKRRGMAPAPFVAKHVIITCTRDSYECFEGIDEDIRQLVRRIETIHVVAGFPAPTPWLDD